MPPLSTKAVDRFTPPALEGQAGAPVYLIAIPSLSGKARYRKAMSAAGVRIWDRDAMIAAARESIERCQPENAADLLEICDRFAALDEQSAAADPEAASEVHDHWRQLALTLQDAGGDFAAKAADNEFWWAMAPLQAARCFLIGREDQPALPRGMDALVPEEALQDIPEEDVAAIGWRALALMKPTEQDVKNSASPQPSPSGQKPSTAASDPSTAGPDGKSSESSTSGTPGSGSKKTSTKS
jgi:hypothetical protein